MFTLGQEVPLTETSDKNHKTIGIPFRFLNNYCFNLAISYDFMRAQDDKHDLTRCVFTSLFTRTKVWFWWPQASNFSIGTQETKENRSYKQTYFMSVSPEGWRLDWEFCAGKATALTLIVSRGGLGAPVLAGPTFFMFRQQPRDNLFLEVLLTFACHIEDLTNVYCLLRVYFCNHYVAQSSFATTKPYDILWPLLALFAISSNLVGTNNQFTI